MAQFQPDYPRSRAATSPRGYPGSHPAARRAGGHDPGAAGGQRAEMYVRSRVYGTPATERGRRRDTTGRAEGNERLTAMTGALLLVLFAAEGITIASIRQLLTLHFFLGMLLIGPVLLKAASTMYRFARYYTGAPDYRRKGPPAPLLRLLGPLVILTSFGVIGTGVMLGFAGSGAGMWLLLHKGMFVLWFGVMTIHVLAYAWRLPRLLGSTSGGAARVRHVLAGRAARWLLLTASVLTGLLLAVLTVHQAGGWLSTHVIGG
jgi:hypothetical protein